jgi:DNA-binding NarL/FixJ family response regulator
LLILAADGDRLDDARRKLLADWCRLVGRRIGGNTPDQAPPSTVTPAGPVARPSPAAAVDALGLPPRMAQILRSLLAGASEKQIALQLAISPHTVHTYVKQLHKRLDVSSRGELLAKFVGLDA